MCIIVQPTLFKNQKKGVNHCRQVVEKFVSTFKLINKLSVTAALKKQATIKPDKTENGASGTIEEKLVKPSAAKLAEKALKPEERPRFGKPGLRTGPKPIEDKTNEKAPERPALRTVKTIDDKVKEKSVTIVDKKTEKNGTAKANSTVNDKLLNNKTSTLISSKDKPTVKAVSDKQAAKTAAEKPALKPVEKSEPLKSALKKVEKTEVKEKPATKVEKAEVAVKLEETPKMATKPPTPIEKAPSKVMNRSILANTNLQVFLRRKS